MSSFGLVGTVKEDIERILLSGDSVSRAFKSSAPVKMAILALISG